jgi:hypothetical protein
MITRHAFVIGSLLMLLSACTDAGKCTRGEPGCPCTRTATCNDINGDNTLPCPSDGMCTMPSGGAGGAGNPLMPRDAGPPPEVECEGDTVEEACELFCEALCQNQARFCYESECAPGACEANGDVAAPCIEQCGDTGCARDLCEEQLSDALTCEDFGFQAGGVFVNLCLDADPMCVPQPELGCTNTCGSRKGGLGGDLTDNGRCEDGKDGDSVSAFCPRGTDCEDCGAHPCVPQGEDCENHGDCCGFYSTGALCVTVTADAAPVCLRSCDDDLPCDDGYVCSATDSAGRMRVCAPRR